MEETIGEKPQRQLPLFLLFILTVFNAMMAAYIYINQPTKIDKPQQCMTPLSMKPYAPAKQPKLKDTVEGGSIDGTVPATNSQ